MARVNSNNTLSGALGDLVYVKDGSRHYVRTKPDKVKQSPWTKAAAAAFGLASAKEKWLRRHLLRALGFPSLQYLAARHRARLRKTVLPVPDAQTGKPVFGNPEALQGFEFNPALEWSRCTNFYLTMQRDDEGGVMVQLPELKWGRELVLPPGTTAARLILHAVEVNLNAERPSIRKLGQLDHRFTRGTVVAAQDWILPAPEASHWTLVLGSLYFERSGKPNAECFSGSYLWTGTEAVPV